MREPADSTQPLVSIIIACFNQARFVVECLESIRQQTYPNIQLIILDDCSQDDSVHVIQSWLDAHNVQATFIPHQKNMGVCSTFNEGLSRATGDFVSIIAADDVVFKWKVERQVKMFQEAPEDVGVIYSDCFLMDENGDPLPSTFLEAHLPVNTPPSGDLFPILLKKNFIPVMSTMVRRECYEKVGKFDEKLTYEDYDMWLRISQHYRFAFSSYVSAKYRIVATSISRTATQLPTWKTLDTNFRIYEKCLPRAKKDSSLRRLALDQLNTVAVQLYELNHRNRTRHLVKLTIYDPRPFTFGLFAFSVARLPFVSFSSCASKFRTLKESLTTALR